jgi:hypothetical protein
MKTPGLKTSVILTAPPTSPLVIKIPLPLNLREGVRGWVKNL